MSKHHAAEDMLTDDLPHTSDRAWIEGLVRPIAADNTSAMPFYGSLRSANARHLRAEPDDRDFCTETGPIRRVSVDEVDALIRRLDDSSTSSAAAAGHPAAPASAFGAAPAHAAPLAVLDLSTRVTPRAARRGRRPLLVFAAATLCLLTIAGGTATALGRTTTAEAAASTVAPAAAVPRLLTGSVARALTNSTVVSEDRGVVADRSRTLPVEKLPSTAPHLHTIGLAVGGRTAGSVTTSAETVGRLLTEQGVSLGPLDSVSPPLTTALVSGLQVSITRTAVTALTSTVTLPEPAAQTVDDPTLAKGTLTATQQGHSGVESVSYLVTTVNGRQTSRVQTGTRVVRAPAGTVTHLGTKTSFTYSGSEVFTNDTSFGVNWDGLAMCESTHNPRAINANPSAGLPTYGMFQFDLPTWESVGGSGNPIDASPEEQLMRAKLLYQSRGLSPWACAYAAR